jgi:hypothetical protein
MTNDSVAIALGLSCVVFFVVLYVWMALALSALFRKAGEEGWKGWVPVLNQAVLLQLGGFSPWLILLLLIPGFGGLVVYVLYVMSAHRINVSFGYGAGMTVLAALLPVIWASVLGFGTAQWISAPAGGPVRSSQPAPPPVAPLAGGWTPSAPTPPPPPLAGPQQAPAASAPPAWAPAPPAPSWSPTVGLGRDLEDSAVDAGDRAPAPSPQPAGSFTPPPAPPAVPGPGEPVAPISSVPGVRSAPPPEPAPAPVSDVPPARPAPPAPEPWAPAPPTARPAADTFPELSEAISAVAGAPDAGAPRSARSSVSALYADPGVPDEDFGAEAADDEPIDRTIIAKRRRTPWKLIPPSGAPIDIGSDVVILGRRPAPDPAYPDAQLVAIPDDTRTVSKTHARLELRGDTWYVTDLGSTNGVLFATLMGTEVEAQPGQELEAGERFFLGDAEVRLRRSEP